jgi:alpha-N-arabinofuranosidase
MTVTLSRGRLARYLGLAILVAIGGVGRAAGAPIPVDVRLDISAEAAGPRIEPEIYGQFVEHLGRGVYDGLWVGPDSPIPNVRGWRRDLVDALRRIGVPVIRWPGGCFADDYDWRDGIGDPARRPMRQNHWWGGAESNRVGTHEFMDLAEQIGAQVYIAGNMGSLPPRAMSQWLEYMTSDGQSALAEERRRNGREQPWRVRYLGVGNESWGCGGNMTPSHQADLHRQYATFLFSPVQRVASDTQGREDATETLMKDAGDKMDALSLHYYTVPGPWEHKGAALGFDETAWARTLHEALGIEDRIAATSRVMDKFDPRRRVALFVDEWGTWYDTDVGASALHQQNSLRDALVAALTFNVFHRHTDRVKMANIAQMVNVLQALALTDGPRMLLTPTYHVFELYQPFKGATPLRAALDTPRYREGAIELPAVDASVARGVDGKTYVALANLDPRRPARVTTTLSGGASAQSISAPSMDGHNEFAQPDRFVPASLPVRRVGGRLVVELPPMSITLLAVEAAH